MKVSHTKPPNYDKCVELFGVDWEKGVVFTYGDTCYAKNPLSQDLEVHELTHVEQQTKIGVEEWWEKYYVDEEFRLSQEIEAYKNQLEFIKTNYNRHERRRLEKHIYHSLSSIYGGICSEEEAKDLLK